MSAELLRRAAAKMRETATAATPGPWDAQGREVGSGESLVAWVPIGYAADAEHIASWPPAVALAVADWLDFIAPFARFGDDNSPHAKHALVVARIYLGESS
jgi:hypothetical protein